MTGRARRGFLSVVAAVAVIGGALAALVATAPAAVATVFSNTTAFTVADATCGGPAGKASLYPSNITVSGATGTVSHVAVSLKGMTGFEGDFEVLLVGPSAAGSPSLELLSDAGSTDVSNFNLTLDDTASAVLNSGGAWSSPAKPTDQTELIGSTNFADTFPSPAPSSFSHPAPTGSATLGSTFNGINPNGTWSLYVVDDGCGNDPGFATAVAGGWSLDITTSAGATTTTAVSSSLNPSTSGNSVAFTATVTSSGSPVTTGTVTFSEGTTTLASNVALNGSGQAVFTTTALTEGDHTITATYNGTAAFATSNGSLSQRVDNATTVTGNTYCNTGSITVPASSKAGVYPSHITVSGFTGVVATATAQLKNVSDTNAEDLSVLLVGPTATNNLVLVSDAGNGSATTTNVSVTFDDAASGSIPGTGAWAPANTSVTSKPVDYSGNFVDADSFPSPAPATVNRPQPTGTASLASAFSGINPNGVWSLYVASDGAPDVGTIGGGWCVTLVPVADVAVTKTTAGGPVVAGTNLTYSIGVSDIAAGSTAQSVSLTDPLPAHTTFVSLASPGSWSCSAPLVGATGTVSCSRTTLTPADGTQSFSLVVRADLQTPSATSLANTAMVSATGDTSAGGNNVASTTTPVTFAPSRPAIVRSSTSWLLRNTLTTGTADNTFSYGTTPLVPLMGDWDGDGIRTPGTFENGVFKLRNSNSAGGADVTFTFGDPRGFALAGDFNGDGKDDVAVYANGLWQIRMTGTGATSSFSFGSGSWPTTVPVVGDWNGDGVDGIGTYAYAGGSAGQWNLRNTASAGAPDAGTFTYNPGTNPYPVVGDWDGDGIDSVGVKSATGTTWALRNSNSAGTADITFDFGQANTDLPQTWRQVTP